MKEGGSLFPELIKGLAKPNGTARFIEVAAGKEGITIYNPDKINLPKNFSCDEQQCILNSTERLKQ